MTDLEKRQMISKWIEGNPKYVFKMAHKISWRLKGRKPTVDEFEDYCQEFAAQILEHSHKYEPERASISTWVWWRMKALVTKTRNAAKKDLILQASFEFDEFGTWDENLPGREVEPCDVVCQQEMECTTNDAILKTIDELNPPQAWAVYENIIHGSTITEMAEKRGVTYKAAKENLARGRKNLRKSMRLNKLAKLMGVC